MCRVRTAEIVPANRAVVGLAYVAGYVALDRISFVEPYASFGITPWKQVLLNLVRNSIEAISDGGATGGSICDQSKTRQQRFH